MTSFIKYLFLFILGFVAAVFAEDHLPHTKFLLGCYQDGDRVIRTDAWIHQSRDPAHIYYPVGWGVTVLHSYSMWFNYKARHINCDKMKDGNKQ